MAWDWLKGALPLAGTVIGNMVLPGIGGFVGGGLGLGIAGAIPEDPNSPSSDPMRLQDQMNQRNIAASLYGNSMAETRLNDLAGQILNGSNAGGIGLQGQAAWRELSGQLAGRGLGNSGVAGAAYGSLYSGLLQQLATDRLNRQQAAAGMYGQAASLGIGRMQAAASIYNNAGERPQTQGESNAAGMGSLTGQYMPTWLELYKMENANRQNTSLAAGR